MGTTVLDFTAVAPESGGVGVVAAGVLTGLLDVDQDVRVLVSRSAVTSWQSLLDERGLDVCLDVAGTRVWDSGSGWQRSLRALVPPGRRPAWALRTLRRARARSTSSTTVSGGVTWYPFHRVPVTASHPVVTVHDLRVFDPAFASAADQRIVRENVDRASAVIVSWPHPFEQLLDLVPAAATKTFMIPLPAMNIGSFASRSPAQGAVRLLYPAALTTHKNHETLIRAMPLMPEATLVLTGPEDAGTAESSRRLADDLGVSDRITWRGFVGLDALEAEYERADMLVVPSRWEAASGPVLEAVTRGLPLVTSAIPPLIRQLDELGLQVPTFEPTDPAALAACVELVRLDYAGHVSRLRAPAERLAARTWTSTARDYARVFAWADGRGPRPDDLMSKVSR